MLADIIRIVVILIICIVLGFCLMGVIVALATDPKKIDRGESNAKSYGGGFVGAGRSKSEAAVIAALEHITHAKFPQGYPKWLRECGRQLELDGWNEEMKIALEFSGPLHTKWEPGKESREKFLQRIGRDAYKRAVCRQMGVLLIVVDASIPKDTIYDYIRSRLHDGGKLEKPVNYQPVREPIYEIV